MKCGGIGNARPCVNCLKMMQDIGIKKVYYSSGKGNEIINENVKNMVSIQISSVSRYCNNLETDMKKNNYLENLIKKVFPKKIKENNLFYFLEYNFKNVLPDYSYSITSINKLKIIVIYDDKNKLVTNSEII